MPSLLSMLVAELLLALSGFVFGLVIVQALDWLSMPARWNSSQLPNPDPAYDFQYDGWWCEDVHELQEPPWSGPGLRIDGLIYRWHPSGEPRLQFLLTPERVMREDPRVWVVLYDARL